MSHQGSLHARAAIAAGRFLIEDQGPARAEALRCAIQRRIGAGTAIGPGARRAARTATAADLDDRCRRLAIAGGLRLGGGAVGNSARAGDQPVGPGIAAVAAGLKSPCRNRFLPPAHGHRGGSRAIAAVAALIGLIIFIPKVLTLLL